MSGAGNGKVIDREALSVEGIPAFRRLYELAARFGDRNRHRIRIQGGKLMAALRDAMVKARGVAYLSPALGEGWGGYFELELR